MKTPHFISLCFKKKTKFVFLKSVQIHEERAWTSCVSISEARWRLQWSESPDPFEGLPGLRLGKQHHEPRLRCLPPEPVPLSYQPAAHTLFFSFLQLLGAKRWKYNHQVLGLKANTQNTSKCHSHSIWRWRGWGQLSYTKPFPMPPSSLSIFINHSWNFLHIRTKFRTPPFQRPPSFYFLKIRVSKLLPRNYQEI